VGQLACVELPEEDAVAVHVRTLAVRLHVQNFGRDPICNISNRVRARTVSKVEEKNGEGGRGGGEAANSIFGFEW
jgi:hypothetical protein